MRTDIFVAGRSLYNGPEKYGTLSLLDLKGPSYVDVMGEMGRRLQDPARQVIGLALANYPNYGDFKLGLDRATESVRLTEDKIRTLPDDVRDACIEGLSGASQWADGIFKGWSHPYIEELRRSGGYNSLDLAVFSGLEDPSEANGYTPRTGCATWILSTGRNSAALMHLEENSSGDAVDKSRLGVLTVPGGRMMFTVYPGLLPGSAEGSNGRNHVQAVDSLYLRSDMIGSGVDPNLITYLMLRVGNRMPASEFIQHFEYFSGGYALNTVQRIDGRVISQRTQFVNGDFVVDSTSADSGQPSVMFQANLITSPPLIGYQFFADPHREELMRERARQGKLVSRAIEAEMRKGRFTQAQLLELGQRCFRLGHGKIKFQNGETVSHALTYMGDEGMSRYIGPGASAEGEEFSLYNPNE